MDANGEITEAAASPEKATAESHSTGKCDRTGQTLRFRKNLN